MESLLFIVSILVLGRAALALTPAGRPGYHEARELPFTLAASWLLGAFILVLCLNAARFFGIESESAPLLALPLVLVALVKWSLGPAAMVPRHEPHRGPVSQVTWALLAAAFGLLIFAVVQAADPSMRPLWVPPPLKVLAAMALTVLAAEGLRTLHRPAWAVLVVALLAFVRATGDSPFVGFSRSIGGIEILSGGGAAFALASWRRADKRAMTLAVLSFAGLPLVPLTVPIEAKVSDLLPMILGLAILCALQPAASRSRLVKMSAAAALFSTAVFFVTGPKESVDMLTESPYPALIPFALLLPIAFALGIRRRESEFVGLFLLVSGFLVCGQIGGSFRIALGALPLCIAAGLSASRSSHERIRSEHSE